ncbi:MAG: hypothetical protein ISP71_07505 [Flavobacteriales bacterium]|nr:hypothetical protein [Flavobacteriales bacterium]
MKAFFYLLILLTISTFYSCGDEEEVTMNENLVYTIFDITNGNGRSFNVMTQAGSESFTANSNSFSFTTNTFSATALSGTTFYYMMQLYFDYANNDGCVDVNAKTYLNGSLYENRSYSIGYANFPTDLCPNNTTIGEMYGIIAD